MNDATQSPIAEYRTTEAALADLRTKYEAVVYDVTDRKGMAQAKEARKELRDVRVALEKNRVEIKAPALQRCRDIDGEAKRITEELEALERPIDNQIKAEEQRVEREKQAREQAERDRVERLRASMDQLKAMAVFHVEDKTAEEIDETIALAEAYPVGDHDEINQAGVRFQVQLTVNALRANRDKRVAWEVEQVRIQAERAELERLRAEQAARQAEELERQRQAAADGERARIAEQERVRAEAAAQEAVDRAQREAAEAAAKAERERQEQEARHARELEEAAQRERDRIAAEQAEAARVADRERQEAERKAARVAHRRKINRAAADALMDHGFAEEHAQCIVTLIAEGKIPGVTVNY